MAQYQIPDRFLPGFKHLLSLSQSQIDVIVATLKQLPVGTGPRTMIDSLTEQIPLPNISAISQAIYSMGNLLASNENSNHEIAEGLAEAYFSNEEAPSRETKLDLTTKIEQILNAGESLKISFKAFNLLAFNKCIYKRGRLVSDIRLVFNEHLDNPQRHGLIIHQLKLEHQTDKDIGEFFITLDTNDLLKLKEQIERALEKEKQIKKSYGKALNFIEITE